MIKFTRANQDDAKRLTDLQIKTFDDDSRRYFNRPAGGPPGYDSIDTMINDVNTAIYYKILDDDEIIGGIYIHAIDDNHYELTTIFIDPKVQNRGIGQKAMLFLEKEFPNITKWTLDTPSVCVRNHHVYEKMGYKKVEEILLDEVTSLYLYLYEKTINR